MAFASGVNSYLNGSILNTLPLNNIYGGTSYPSWVSSTNPNRGMTGVSPSRRVGLPADDAKSYLAAVKNFGTKLMAAATKTKASAAGQSVFGTLTGTSSKTDALSIRVTDQSDAAKFNNVKNVSIETLATAQENSGTFLSATSLSGANKGTNQFTIEQNGKSYSFSVNINMTDSARTAQQKAADAINKQNIGVTASVRYDDKTRRSALVLTSKDTGAKNAFTIADTPGRGNLAESMGVGQATQDARDARYTVDGEVKTSASNTVNLGNGITGTLKKADTGDIAVSVKKDVDMISSVIRDIVDNFNGLLKTAKDNGSDRGAMALRQRLDTVASSYSRSLANIGITRSKDGYLETDSEKLTKAFQDGQAERNLGNSSAGFTQRLSQIAKQAGSNPGQFLSYESRNNINNGNNNSNNAAAGWTEGIDYNFYKYSPAYRNIGLSNIGLLLNMGL